MVITKLNILQNFIYIWKANQYVWMMLTFMTNVFQIKGWNSCSRTIRNWQSPISAETYITLFLTLFWKRKAPEYQISYHIILHHWFSRQSYTVPEIRWMQIKNIIPRLTVNAFHLSYVPTWFHHMSIKANFWCLEKFTSILDHKI